MIDQVCESYWVPWVIPIVAIICATILIYKIIDEVFWKIKFHGKGK